MHALAKGDIQLSWLKSPRLRCLAPSALLSWITAESPAAKSWSGEPLLCSRVSQGRMFPTGVPDCHHFMSVDAINTRAWLLAKKRKKKKKKLRAVLGNLHVFLWSSAGCIKEWWKVNPLQTQVLGIYLHPHHKKSPFLQGSNQTTQVSAEQLSVFLF